jgi:hypothetical protein
LRAFSSLLVDVQSHLGGEDDPEEKLRVMVRTHIAHVARSMATLKVCSHELDSLTGEAYEQTHVIRRRYYDETRKIIDRLLDSYGVNGGIDRHVATMYLFGALNWLYRWYDPKRGRPPSSIAKQITAQFLHGIVNTPLVCGRSANHHAGLADEPAITGGRRRRKTPVDRT